MYYPFLAAKGQSIILFNCKVFENYILCGCAIFFTDSPQKLYTPEKEVVNLGRKVVLPQNLEIKTYATISSVQDDIQIFFEKL